MINRLLQFPSSTGGVTATPSLHGALTHPPPKGSARAGVAGLGWDGRALQDGLGQELPCRGRFQPRSHPHLFEAKICLK